jgi:hypothetical protein
MTTDPDAFQAAVAAYERAEQQLAWWAVATARYFGDDPADNDDDEAS